MGNDPPGNSCDLLGSFALTEYDLREALAALTAVVHGGIRYGFHEVGPEVRFEVGGRKASPSMPAEERAEFFSIHRIRVAIFNGTLVQNFRDFRESQLNGEQEQFTKSDESCKNIVHLPRRSKIVRLTLQRIFRNFLCLD